MIVCGISRTPANSPLQLPLALRERAGVREPEALLNLLWHEQRQGAPLTPAPLPGGEGWSDQVE